MVMNVTLPDGLPGGYQSATFITERAPPRQEAVPMRIYHACGNPQCGEEYPTDTKDRLWKCPHCDRELPNPFYPFLTARLMNARIHPDDTDWKEMHDELLSTANRKHEHLRERIEDLERDLRNLKALLPYL